MNIRLLCLVDVSIDYHKRHCNMGEWDVSPQDTIPASTLIEFIDMIKERKVEIHLLGDANAICMF